jgi:hypothetical protein
MIEQRTHMSQIPAQAGVVAARAAGRVRTAPFTVAAAFCSPVLTTTDKSGGIPTPHRRPPIE